MAKQECDVIALSLAHLQQRPTDKNRATWECKCNRFPLRRDPDAEGEPLLLDVGRQPATNLRGKSCGLIFLHQGHSLLQRRRQVAAQTYLGAQGVLLRSAHQVESV